MNMTTYTPEKPTHTATSMTTHIMYMSTQATTPKLPATFMSTHMKRQLTLTPTNQIPITGTNTV